MATITATEAGSDVLMHVAGATTREFKPPASDVNFVLLAAFYAGAQVIERLMELVVPALPAWPPGDSTGNVRAAYVKADRAKVALGVATVAAVVVSAAFGLYFLKVLGIHATHTVDTIATGLIIGAGTKPLHDFITLIQKPKNPTTGTTASS
jgi:hypothetical protein